MDLNFTKSAVSNAYIAEFEAASDFNLHIENGRNVSLYQRSVPDGGYAEVRSFNRNYNGLSFIDADFLVAVSPKYIRVVSDTVPTRAVVTFNS